MSDQDFPEFPELPNRWQAIDIDKIYRSNEGRLVSFSQAQIELGLLYDALGKHLRAINKGLVPTKGNNGLVPSEEQDYDFKFKILGKGGDRRFHAKIVEDILHFSGKMTTH
ncbi:hypothetical protein [Leptolyngbya sp. NIES-2104]|uniref:hypothetical protein n=1 Tax=Leptolyngbya sp. NIES-2104 TaxID=1552121 RepID=UPI0006EC7661|nr:hypothetical protein [Leptolyngbya sp. NIES-2104]GAP98555.1 hypothetical protein NIES2104_51100 [Leptolyngbya sp. NIES-2104]